MNERISLLEGRPFYFKILVLITLILFGMSIIGGLGYYTIQNLFGLSPEDISNGLNGNSASLPANAVRILQGFYSLGMFLAPALAFSQLSKDNEIEFFGFHKKIQPSVWLLVIILMFAVSPVIDGLVYLNYNLPYPAFMADFVDDLIAQQEMVGDQMEHITKMDSWDSLMINLLIIAFIPAIGEEWLFRGVIQKLFIEHYHNKHASIWLTGFFFAVLHQSIFYVFGLWILGALLGYLKEWSGNIWLPVLAHFINNATILLVSFFAPDLIGDLNSITFDWLPFLGGLIVSVGLTYLIWKLLKSNSDSTLAPTTIKDI